MADPIGYPSRFDVGYREEGASYYGAPVNFVSGFEASNLGGTMLTIQPGICRDDTNTADIEILTSKTIDMEALSPGLGSPDVLPVTPGNWYYLFAIKNPSTGQTGVIITLNFSGPLMPAGFTLKRRIGSFFYHASFPSFWKFRQIGSGRSRKYLYLEDTATSLLRLLNGGPAVAWTLVSCNIGAPQHNKSVILQGRELGIVSTSIRPRGEVMTWYMLFTRAASGDVGSGGCEYIEMPTGPSLAQIEYNHPNGAGGLTYLEIVGFTEEL